MWHALWNCPVLCHVFLWTCVACDETSNAWEVEVPFVLTGVYTEKAVLAGEREDCSEGFLVVPRASRSPGCWGPCWHTWAFPASERGDAAGQLRCCKWGQTKVQGWLIWQASRSHLPSSGPADPAIWQPPGKAVLETIERLLC